MVDTSYELSWLVEESALSPRGGKKGEEKFRMTLLEVLAREGIMSVLKQLADDLSHSRSSRRLRLLMQSHEVVQQLSALREEQNTAVRALIKNHGALVAERDDACQDREAAAKDLDALLRSLDAARGSLVRLEYHARSLLHLPEARGLRVVLEELRAERAPLPVFGGSTQALAALASPGGGQEEGAGAGAAGASPGGLSRHASLSVAAAKTDRERADNAAQWSPRRVDAERQRRHRAVGAVRELVARAVAVPAPAPPLHAELASALHELCTDAEQLLAENESLREALAVARAPPLPDTATPRNAPTDETGSPQNTPEWRVRMLRQKTALQKALGQARDQRDALARELQAEIQRTGQLRELLQKEQARAARSARERAALYKRIEELESKFLGDRPPFRVPMPRPRETHLEALKFQLQSCEAHIDVLERRLRKARAGERSRRNSGASTALGLPLSPGSTLGAPLSPGGGWGSASAPGSSPPPMPASPASPSRGRGRGVGPRPQARRRRGPDPGAHGEAGGGGARGGAPLPGPPPAGHEAGASPANPFEARIRTRFAAAAGAAAAASGSGSGPGAPAGGSPDAPSYPSRWRARGVGAGRLVRAEAHIRSLLQTLSDALAEPGTPARPGAGAPHAGPGGDDEAEDALVRDAAVAAAEASSALTALAGPRALSRPSSLSRASAAAALAAAAGPRRAGRCRAASPSSPPPPPRGRPRGPGPEAPAAEQAPAPASPGPAEGAPGEGEEAPASPASPGAASAEGGAGCEAGAGEGQAGAGGEALPGSGVMYRL
eukprot:tig00021569_g22348.t1